MSNKEKEIYGGMLYEYKPTILSLIRILLSKPVYEKTLKKQSLYKEDSGFRPDASHIRDLPLQYIAIVKDSKVEELIRIDENTANLLLDKTINLVPYDNKEIFVTKGMSYIDNNFIKENNDKEN